MVWQPKITPKKEFKKLHPSNPPPPVHAPRKVDPQNPLQKCIFFRNTEKHTKIYLCNWYIVWVFDSDEYEYVVRFDPHKSSMAEIQNGGQNPPFRGLTFKPAMNFLVCNPGCKNACTLHVQTDGQPKNTNPKNIMSPAASIGWARKNTYLGLPLATWAHCALTSAFDKDSLYHYCCKPTTNCNRSE